MSRFRSGSAASVAIAVALGAIAFAAASGTQIGRAASTEAVVLIVAGLALAAVLFFDSADRRPLYGGGAVLALTVLVAFTGLSMSWSIAPDLSLQEMGRSLTYLAVFAVAVAGARRFPSGGEWLLRAVLLTSLAVCGWALLTRMVPGVLAEQVFVARLAGPFDYWNALGGMAALGVPGTLWLAARRDGRPAWAALAYPALGLLVITILLTQSRGALGAALIAVLVWLAVVPLRLRTAPVLIASVLAVAPSAWALSQDAFTESFQPLSAREDVAGPFALFVLVTLAVLGVVGWLVVRRREAQTLDQEQRRAAGNVLAGLLALVLVGGFVAAAVSGGGFAGRIDSLTSSDSTVEGAGAGRLASTSSSRGEYWRQAFDVFKEAPVVGRGADGFSLARLQYRNDPQPANHAHGFLPQVGADLGLLGLGIAAALFLAWLWAVRRTLDVPMRRDSPRLEWTPDRIALTALALSVLTYGIQGAIDWIWFVPGVTVAALAAAGFLAGRGPATDSPPARAAPRFDALRVTAAGAVVVTALLCAWSVWQPERARQATDQAIDLSARGDLPGALRAANRARDIDPYSAEPLYTQALVLTDADRPVAAYRALERAVAEHPRDPETWLRLGTFELDQLDLAVRASRAADAAFTIDPQDYASQRLGTRAKKRVAEQQASVAPLVPGTPKKKKPAKPAP